MLILHSYMGPQQRLSSHSAHAGVVATAPYISAWLMALTVQHDLTLPFNFLNIYPPHYNLDMGNKVSAISNTIASKTVEEMERSIG